LNLTPIDAQFPQPSPILYGWGIRTAKMQPLLKIERQLLGPLRLNDTSVLIKGEAMSAI
jgi:hypothetical protein